ncbi:hypothetical protein D3C72_1623650 [compost metagenome]
MPELARSNMTEPCRTNVSLLGARNFAELLPVTSTEPLPLRSRTNGSETYEESISIRVSARCLAAAAAWLAPLLAKSLESSM